MGATDRTFDVKVTRDVPYGSARVAVSTTPKERVLRLDVYEPAAPAGGSRAALILAFGGAFHRGSKETDEFGEGEHRNTPIPTYCREFARRGYVAFSIDYRLVQEDPDPGDTPVIGEPSKIPRSRVDHVRGLLGLPPATMQMLWAGIEAACDDMVKAFRFVESHSKSYGVDPARIAVGGFSAGARTSLNAVYGERLPAAAVLSLSGYMATDDLQRHVAMGRQLPPAFLVTGENDLDYIAGQAQNTDRHFSRVGVPHEAWTVPGATHFYPASSPIVSEGGRRSTLELALNDFVQRTLGSP